MRNYLIAGNWKMHGSLRDNAALIAGIREANNTAGVEFLVCPTFVHLPSVASEISGSTISLGAQNVSEHAKGAHTGEVSASMLAELQVRYVIVGHSERRSLYGESDDEVARKFSAAQSEGLIPILCVGETLEQREADETAATVERQIDAVLDACGIESFASAVVAYEPVWAIGTGMTASPEQAQEVHRSIREKMSALNSAIGDQLRILYGGSMKGSNAAGLLAMPDIDGGLIGGASLKAEEFLAIGHAASA